MLACLIDITYFSQLRFSLAEALAAPIERLLLSAKNGCGQTSALRLDVLLGVVTC
jgi:hypothetical protein